MTLPSARFFTYRHFSSSRAIELSPGPVMSSHAMNLSRFSLDAHPPLTTNQSLWRSNHLIPLLSKIFLSPFLPCPPFSLFDITCFTIYHATSLAFFFPFTYLALLYLRQLSQSYSSDCTLQRYVHVWVARREDSEAESKPNAQELPKPKGELCKEAHCNGSSIYKSYVAKGLSIKSV